MGKLTKPMRKRRNYARAYGERGISTSRVKRSSSGSNGKVRQVGGKQEDKGDKGEAIEGTL